MQNQFKIICYTNSRDYTYKKNGIVITDIETLLHYVNKSHYWTSSGKEVLPTEDWDIVYNEFMELRESPLNYIDIIEKPTDTSLRIIGISIFFALTQKTGKFIYDSIIDPDLSKIPQESMSLYPYTMNEFISLIANNPNKLNLLSYNYIGILKH